jgi:hypothetical protein
MKHQHAMTIAIIAVGIVAGLSSSLIFSGDVFYTIGGLVVVGITVIGARSWLKTQGGTPAR